jgi:hypothetical protein
MAAGEDNDMMLAEAVIWRAAVNCARLARARRKVGGFAYRS